MKKLTHTLLLGLFLNFGLQAQTHNGFHQTLVDQVSQPTIETNLTTFANFGEKELGSTAQTNALNWLKGLYESWGYTHIEQQAVSAWGQTGYNLIVTKQGTVYPDTYIIIDGHYDTINGPGANDNGSGTSIILEAARILRNVPTEYSIKFIHFTAEEWGLIGSEKYVSDIVIPQGLDIKLVLNIDQVGGVAGDINDTITCEKDESGPNYNNSQSAAVTNELRTLMGLYSSLNTVLGPAYGSDYVPFQEAGFVITGLYETNESPYPHSSQDTVENVDFDFIFQVAKGTLGALSYFAKAYDELSVNEVSSSKIQVFPNPADQSIQIKSPISGNSQVQLVDLIGKMVYANEFSGNEFQISTTHIPNGIYLLNFSNAEFKTTQKIIVQHK